MTPTPVDLVQALREAIAAWNARLAVIGLGFVGTPVACKLAQAGFRVTGINVASEKVAKVNAGVSPIEGNEPGLKELLAEVVRDHGSGDDPLTGGDLKVEGELRLIGMWCKLA